MFLEWYALKHAAVLLAQARKFKLLQIVCFLNMMLTHGVMKAVAMFGGRGVGVSFNAEATHTFCYEFLFVFH